MLPVLSTFHLEDQWDFVCDNLVISMVLQEHFLTQCLMAKCGSEMIWCTVEIGMKMKIWQNYQQNQN